MMSGEASYLGMAEEQAPRRRDVRPIRATFVARSVLTHALFTNRTHSSATAGFLERLVPSRLAGYGLGFNNDVGLEFALPLVKPDRLTVPS